MPHAEALFLIHHQQTEIGEDHIFREQPVRADQNVDLTHGHAPQYFLDLLRRTEAADHFHRQREGCKPLLKSLVMLEREHRSRRQHRDLLVVAQRLESRAHRHFRFAVTNVAAQQPIHRKLRFHVALHVGDGLRLVTGLVVFERVLKLLHPFGIGWKNVPACGLALRIKFDQFVGHVLHRLAHTRLGLSPSLRAEVIQNWLRALCRAIFLHQIKPSQRNIEPRRVRIFQHHEFRNAVALVNLL